MTAETETTMATDTVPAIERRIELRASPERVWRALTDPGEISGWFGQRTSFTPVVGAGGWFEWDGQGRYHARVERVQPGRALTYRWARHANVDVDDGPSTLVEWELQPARGGGTILRLRESGFVEHGWRTGNVEGWLDELADLAAHVAAEPWQAGYRQKYAFTSSPDRVWRALSDPAELRAWQGWTEITAGEVGVEVWVSWPDRGRFAIRIDAVEPPDYIASSHTIEPDVSLSAAAEVLHAEWFLKPRPDGGTDVLLFEMGYLGPDRQAQNAEGWDMYLIPVIRRYLGEGEAAS